MALNEDWLTRDVEDPQELRDRQSLAATAVMTRSVLEQIDVLEEAQQRSLEQAQGLLREYLRNPETWAPQPAWHARIRDAVRGMFRKEP